MIESLFRKQTALALLASVFVLVACSDKEDKGKPKPKEYKLASVGQPGSANLIRSNYEEGDVTALCSLSINAAQKELDAIAKIAVADRNFDNTMLALENATADLSDRTSPLTFMGYVHTNPKIGAEGADCESKVGQLYVQIFTRRDLYQAIEKATPRTPEEARLLQKTLEGFEANGLKLSDDVLSQVRDLKSELSKLESKFSANLVTDNTNILFTKEELEGLPADFIKDLTVGADGKLIVPANEGTYPAIMQNAVKSETRKKMMSGYLSRGASAGNADLLSQAVVLRAKIAKLMGYNTWADYRTHGRMAQDGKTVLEFLNGLKGKLALRTQEDLGKVLKFKQESIPTAKTLDQWDISYYSYQLQKRDYSLDNEKIKEYLPAKTVIERMFSIYSKMLGVAYVRITNEQNVWHKSVDLFEIHEKDASGPVIGYFYTDFIPRDNKYDHAAAFPLISGRKLSDGSYSLPVASIVANLSGPIGDKPSLLSHDDVETMFHEFGHIMHQTLTRAPYASLSGSSTAQDFVEAPSQMLENWVWSSDMLTQLTSHYKTGVAMPADLINQMIAAKDFNMGYAYTKQLTYGLFDMTLHTQDAALDVNKVYLDTYRSVMGQEPLLEQQFPANFGHMMGGYDAGYYGYIWSEVYAQDMFSQFPAANLTDSAVGGRYRKNILEQGNMKDALELLKDFLGREPNSDAFFKKLHI